MRTSAPPGLHRGGASVISAGEALSGRWRSALFGDPMVHKSALLWPRSLRAHSRILKRCHKPLAPILDDNTQTELTVWRQLGARGIQHAAHLVVHVHKRHVWANEPNSDIDDADRGVLVGRGKASVPRSNSVGHPRPMLSDRHL